MSRQQSLVELKLLADGLVKAAEDLRSRISQFLASEELSDAGTGSPAERDLRVARTGLILTDGQRRICERVINVFETGSIAGDYGAISIFEDGPHQIRQITYGRSQTTEYGNLRELIDMYADAAGTFSDALRPFVARIGRIALVDDSSFKDLLRRAGRQDQVMRNVQDVFFDRRYFQPAQQWGDVNGFRRALSMLVIYDSFIHSGGILSFLRARFRERPPAQGGDEQGWIKQYVAARHAWLENNTRADLRKSAYRTRDLVREIAKDNWDLSILPIIANGVPVGDEIARRAPADVALQSQTEAFPYSPDRTAPLDAEDEEIWSELEPLRGRTDSSVLSSQRDLSAFARDILSNVKIALAETHVSGVKDHATARENIEDTGTGNPAQRSSHGNAPGGTVRLDPRLLSSLLQLATKFDFSVSELAGGSHNKNSRHYAGVAADISVINGRRIGVAHPDVSSFQEMCGNLGATEILGPGDLNHDTHVHAAWPRPT